MSPLGPRVLVVTSAGAPAAVVTPILAALEAHGLAVRALDVGRVGSRSSGAAWRVLRALVGELAERRLLRELEQHPPDVALAFDPASAGALAAARDQAVEPAPVVAVVPELDPSGPDWASAGADRYLAVDDAAAVALADAGVDGERVLSVGPFCPLPYARAAREERGALRARFKLAGAVVLVEVDGLGHDTSSQLALQLSLSGIEASYLFAAGSDVDAATALRRQVPTLGIKAKLFGHTTDSPLLWRAADVVVARPRAHTVAKAMAVGARMVALSSDDEGGRALVDALEARRLGIGAKGPLFVSSALEALLGASAQASPVEGEDGAANSADVVWVVGRGRKEIIGEARAAERAEVRSRVEAASAATRRAQRQASAAGDLEDLGGDVSEADGMAGGPAGAAAAGTPPPPDRAEIARLRREIDTRIGRAQRTVTDAQQAAARLQKQAEEARKAGGAGGEAAAREADRGADLERARMHAALTELAELSSERDVLEAAARAAGGSPPPPSAAGAPPPRPPRAQERSVDDLLDEMKRKGSAADSGPKTGAAGGRTKAGADGKGTTVDDELEALKRKMSGKKRGKP